VMRMEFRAAVGDTIYPVDIALTIGSGRRYGDS
jgi:hypothetical protein